MMPESELMFSEIQEKAARYAAQRMADAIDLEILCDMFNDDDHIDMIKKEREELS